MTYEPQLVTGPAAVVITRAEAKAHLAVDADDWNSEIDAFVAAATARLDGWAGTLGRCLINQVWKIRLDRWPADGVIRFPFPNVSAATIKYYAAGGDGSSLTTASGTHWEIEHDARGSFLRLKPAWTRPALFDRPAPVVVEFTAGFGATAAEVPQPIRSAILLIVGHLWQHRGDAASEAARENPLGSERLLAPYRRVWAT
jgi:uncharacterized phiE125 gp8 family phage protein